MFFWCNIWCFLLWKRPIDAQRAGGMREPWAWPTTAGRRCGCQIWGKTEELCNTHPEPDAFSCLFQNSTSSPKPLEDYNDAPCLDNNWQSDAAQRSFKSTAATWLEDRNHWAKPNTSPAIYTYNYQGHKITSHQMAYFPCPSMAEWLMPERSYFIDCGKAVACALEASLACIQSGQVCVWMSLKAGKLANWMRATLKRHWFTSWRESSGLCGL